MRDRPRVRRVQVEVRSEDRETLGIRRLDRDGAAAGQTARGQLDHLGQPLGRQMLHHLRAEDTVERGFRQIGEVVEETDQWYGANYRYVKVRNRDGAVSILRYDKIRAEWELTMFRSARAHTIATRFS